LTILIYISVILLLQFEQTIGENIFTSQFSLRPSIVNPIEKLRQ